MRATVAVCLLFLGCLFLGAQEFITGGVDLASSGSRLASFGWATPQSPIRGRTLKGVHNIYDVASYAMIAYDPFAIECVSNSIGAVSCRYDQNLVTGGSPGRCYRATLAASLYDASGTTKGSNTFGSGMICIPVPDPGCVAGGPPPTSAEPARDLPEGRHSPLRLNPDAEPAAESDAGQPARAPVTLQGAKDCGNSPILVDLENEGFPLSDDPVLFDLDADGTRERTNWTAAGSSVAFLALDRDGNGAIESGLELFGNNTRLSTGEKAQYGYIALAEYDLQALGGNFDGVIGPEDAVWPRLRLWIDRNHDGISQPDELVTLDQAGILKLAYDYEISKRRDRFGDRFLAKGTAWRENRHGKPREIPLWDVWFVRR